MSSVAFWQPSNAKPDRWQIFEQGVRACGLTVNPDPMCLDAGDTLVSWNRHQGKDGHLQALEARGIRIMVVENGYIGHDDSGRRLTSFGWRDHATLGNCYRGPTDRWEDQHVDVKPWRTGGKEVVILGQRSIGRPPVASPRGWEERVRKELKAHTKRPVRIRAHPGKGGAGVSLEEDMANAFAVVTWASSAAIRAMVYGVSVFYAYPKWIAQDAALPYDPRKIEKPKRGDRQRMLRTVSWAQWSDAEIAEGMPFRQPEPKVYRC